MKRSAAAFLLVAFTFNVVLGMNLRQKRQASNDMDDNALDNKYGGWERQSLNSRLRPNPGDDRWIWDNQDQGRQPRPKGSLQSGNQSGNQWQQPIQAANIRQTTSTTTPAAPKNGSTTQSPQIQECIRNCPVTTEYNPVCGTNLVQYSNIGRLECAKSCGVNVSLLRANRCPSSTTAAPTS